MRKRLSAAQQLQLLEASGTDYLLLAAACAIPLFTAGASVLQPFLGLFFVGVAATGILFSFLFRKVMPKGPWSKHLGWLLAAVAIVVAFNIVRLNRALPNEGFEIEFIHMSFLCWLMSLSAFFLWNDGSMLFQTVPGIALFGIISWLDTTQFFEISLILFSVTIAVLLTRLHTRRMYAMARAAGFVDIDDLRRGPWKAMAGPLLAIASMLVVAGIAHLAGPGIGGAVRTLAGSPQISFTPPVRATRASFGIVDRPIGAGPAISSDAPVMRVQVRGPARYLRAHAYQVYRGNGWVLVSRVGSLFPSSGTPVSRVPDAKVYRLNPLYELKQFQTTRILVESQSRRHTYFYSPGSTLRIEYPGNVSVFRDEFPMMGDQFGPGELYYLEAAVPEPTAADLRAAPQADRTTFRSGYLQNDLYDKDVQALATKLAQGQKTDYDVAKTITDYVASNCKYNLAAERITGDRDRVAAFLFDTKEGYCDLFASAVAVLCRSNGIPARVVVGYRLDNESLRNGWYEIQDRHAHMWTEVWFQDYGWVPFDATDNAEAVPGYGVGALLDTTGGDVFRLVAISAGALLGGVGLVLAIAALVNWRRNRRLYSPALRRLRGPYVAFIAHLRRPLRRPKRAAETLSEYTTAYSEVIGNGEVEREIATQFEIALYAQDEPSDEQVALLRSAVATLKANGSGKNGNSRNGSSRTSQGH
ncbi:MAG: transglutaminase domain-containing protein [Armatimonadetes bacterium]|nr:transglutaminase domain-containing protein [Armatimonadota bacterium]NOG93944.1 transglutaminase domain-containing protein [Armatimonadota bacterium]